MSEVVEVQGGAVGFEDGLAPIILVTGLPGAGKSLFVTSQFLKGKAGVYQAGLKGSVFPGIDATKWFNSPHGAVIAVDEAWKWFAPQPPTKEPPECYTRLPEIRHEGRTLILATQHPNDLDARVRRRIGRHYHLVRIFGSERSNVHQWDHCHEDVDSRNETDSFIWEFDKEAYALYKSASLHKIKTEVPRRLKRVPYYIAAALVAIPASLGIMWMLLTPDEVPGQAKAKKQGMFPTPNLPGNFGGKPKAEPLSAEQWMQLRQPRIADLPHTAPAYDQITVPTVAPVIAACVQSASKGCNCWTQQATPIKVSLQVCEQFVKGGMFEDFHQSAPARETTAPDTSGNRGPVPPIAQGTKSAVVAPAGV